LGSSLIFNTEHKAFIHANKIVRFSSMHSRFVYNLMKFNLQVLAVPPLFWLVNCMKTGGQSGTCYPAELPCYLGIYYSVLTCC
jgi:hypothetical protein